MRRVVLAGTMVFASIAATPGRAATPVETLTAWVVASGDNRGVPFAVVDKQAARVFAFDGAGRPRGDAPVLLGLARGDHSVPGIGDRPLASITPAERTTPAGRFDAAIGTNAAGRRILWVDYAAAVSLHAVVTAKPRERRLERLASPTPADNRISYGCINVPVAFFADTIEPLFMASGGVVYVIPEVVPLTEFFVGLAAPAR
ncbi:L,D-transpeptidase [Glacieibacterium frigidum]|uniref:L,D-transpeptidase n=1 Tax=Glacieibacterium frigidum TaxID=2593303 RepID=A0A552UJD7_9SPHN|nr:L,D-transpeptidase [Glacieibacterium frigidum]TRW18356.1 L,D-transpeptidase [Glacieibacterium frigidum]